LARSSPMTDLYTRLQDVGFPRAYVRDRILPEWWDDELARDPGNRRIAEMVISRTLKISLHSLVDPTATLSLEGARAVRFKHWQDADEVRLLPAVALARRIFELLLSCAKTLPVCRLEGCDPKELRERILAQTQYVTLGALLRRCWDLGVPVVHLDSLPQGAKRVDGMAFTVGDRPCIALASSRHSPAWLIWHLAHEMGHVARGHLRTGAALDETIDFKAPDREEKEANTFGKALIYGETAVFKADRHITGDNLAAQARNLGPAHRIWPPCIVTSYGFHMENAWATAQKALNSLDIAKGGPEEIRRELAQRIDLDQLSETDRCFFIRATGVPE